MSPLLMRMMMRGRVMAPEGDDAGSGGTPPAAKQNTQEPQTFSATYVSELRQEAATQRLAKKEAETRADALEADAKKAREEADGKVTAAQTAANERVVRAELKAVAIKAGMIDIDGLKLADLSKVKLNAETGEVEGADELMVELKKAKPFLFGAPGSTSNTETKPPKPGAPESKDARSMTKEEYAKARADIRRGILPSVK